MYVAGVLSGVRRGSGMGADTAGTLREAMGEANGFYLDSAQHRGGSWMGSRLLGAKEAPHLGVLLAPWGF